MIEFDRDTHTFTLNGAEVPGVTRILRDEAWIDTRWYTPEGRDRGSYVHEASALLDRERLDWNTVDDEAIPYLVMWDRAKEELGLRITGIEKIVHKASLYAGIVDREAVWQRRKTVVDLKTGSPTRADKLQITAYGATYKTMPRLLLVYLKPERYRAVELEPDVVEVYRMAWFQIVNLWHWRRREDG